MAPSVVCGGLRLSRKNRRLEGLRRGECGDDDDDDDKVIFGTEFDGIAIGFFDINGLGFWE